MGMVKHSQSSQNSKFPEIAALAITGAIKYTLHGKLYNELGLESLESRRRIRRLCFLHKIISNGLPAYLYELIPKKSHQYMTRNVNDIAAYQCRTDAFISFLGPSLSGIKYILKFKTLHIQFSVSFQKLSAQRNLN